MKTTVGKAEKLITQSLKDSEIRYRRLFEAAQDGILILDARTGMIEDVNPYLIKMLGYSREEFVKKKLWEVGAFRDMEASKEAFEALQVDEYIRYEDLPLRAKNGQLVEAGEIKQAYENLVGHRIGSGQIYRVLHRHGWRKVMPRSRHPQKASDEAIKVSKKLTLESKE